MNHFLAGFYEFVPLNLLQMFNEVQLEQLMCGIGTIDVNDWQENTIYKVKKNTMKFLTLILNTSNFVFCSRRLSSFHLPIEIFSSVKLDLL